MRGVTVPGTVVALTLAVPVVLLPAQPALAAGTAGTVQAGSAPARSAEVFVEANPSTVSAGDEIGLRASCEDNLRAATVTAEPMGVVTVSPRYGFLTATTRVPAATRANDYRVRLRCPDGATATTTLYVIARDRPTRGPATGGGGTGHGDTAPVLIGGGLAAMAGGGLLAVLYLRRRRLG